MKCLTALFCGVGDGGIDGDSTAPAVPVDAEIEGLSDVAELEVVVPVDAVGVNGGLLAVDQDGGGGGRRGTGRLAPAVVRKCAVLQRVAPLRFPLTFPLFSNTQFTKAKIPSFPQEPRQAMA